jgi:hypothetical protein
MQLQLKVGSTGTWIVNKIKKNEPGCLGYTIAGANASFYMFLDLCEGF